jgi:hypothetical protein
MVPPFDIASAKFVPCPFCVSSGHRSTVDWAQRFVAAIKAAIIVRRAGFI